MIRIDNGNDKRQHTLVTIVNWDKYQGGETYSNSGNIEEKQELDIKNNYNNDNDKEEKKEEDVKEDDICVPKAHGFEDYSLEFEEF